ncbi:MAG: Hpt domain-containing protein [Gammaproteobacteria bacterium]
MLDNAHTCLQLLETEAPPSVPTVAPLDPSAFARTLQIPTAGSTGDEFSTTDVGLSPPTLGARQTQVPIVEADPELLALFIEEAREELTKIQRHFPAWEQNPLEQEGLITMRRSFHTLKGSGRMVGARDLSEFAWAIENLLNRLLDNTLTRSPQILSALRDAVAALPQLIDQLESGRPVTANTADIVARAHSLASAKPPHQQQQARQAPAEDATAEKKTLSPAPFVTEPVAAPTKAEPPVSTQLGSDDLLRDIYSRETAAHVAVVRNYVERERNQPGPHSLTEDLYRACHTLSGSSKMAEARHGIRLAEPLDHWLRKAFNSGVGISTPDLDVLADCMTAMESVATHLDESTGYFMTHEGLRLRILQAEAALDVRMADAARAAAEAAAHADAGRTSDDVADDAAAEADQGVPGPTEDITLESPEQMGFESGTVESVILSEDSVQLESSESEHVESVVLEAATFRPGGSEPSDAVDISAGNGIGNSDSSGAPSVVDADEPPVLHTDFDPEVAAIFTDEATELLEVSEQALADWRHDPASADARSALKRPMHTLKGGARMAGIVPMGDLSHEIETLVMQVDNGIVPADDRMFSVLQGCLDELARMRESIAAGHPVAHARSLIARILSLSKPEAPQAAVVSAPPPPPIVAPPVFEPAPPIVEYAAPSFESPAPAEPEAPSELAAWESEQRPVDGELDLSGDVTIEAPISWVEAAGAEMDAPHMPEWARESEPPPPQDIVLSDDAEIAAAEPFVPEVELDPAPVLEPAATEFHDITAAPLSANIISAIPALPPGGAVEGMAFSEPVPAFVERLSEAPAAFEPPAVEEAAPPVAEVEPLAPPPKVEEPVVPAFVERRALAPTTTRSLYPVPKGADGDDHLAPPLPVPPGREPVAPSTDRPEMARVDAELLDTLLNTAGEVSIARARLEQQMGSIDFNLAELSRTVTRLKEQLRKLEIETEAQILHRHEEEGGPGHRSDFDPLELDRYSSIQQFSRALAETANDVQSIQGLLDTLAQDTQNLLQQQARTITELQNGLMRTRMVPFQRHVQRLARIVRQAAADTGKRAELIVEGAAGELDRQVLERMLPPFEHMLRNSVVHGIEKPEERIARGKSDTGRIKLELHREGAEVMVRLSDDGAGMNLKAIRDKALSLGMVPEGAALSDEDAMQLILEPGFSTAGTITQQAGRGVGMDVVATEIKRLGGALHMETRAGEGSTFTIRLPFTLAISHALVVRTGDEYYALPLPTVEGVLRLSKTEVTSHLGRDQPTFDYNGQKYRFQNLALFVGLEAAPLPEQDVTIPVVLVRAGEHSTGLIADELVGSREIVVKSVGPQVSAIRGISGATILGDGRIVVILDIGALVRAEWRGRAQPVQREKTDRRTFVMVVDDSITVRRVTQRLLERNGMRVLTARDGLDAVAQLQDNVPDIILLDIEMPRMDGYEVAAHVRNDPRLANVPIIMITSRVGEKHRARAIELGVNDYLGKPYQEAQLLDAIGPLVERHRTIQGSRRLAEVGEARG